MSETVLHAAEWRCPSCQRPSQQGLEGSKLLRCNHCDYQRPYPTEALDDAGVVRDPVEVCLACGHDRLFAQKDFNRRLGLVVVLIGGVLSPWTYGLSLVACLLLDYGLYRFVPEITVCYGCDAIHRGFEHNPRHKAHDPLLAERYRREAQEQQTGSRT